MKIPLAQCRIFEISFVVWYLRLHKKVDAFLSHCKNNTEDLMKHGTFKHAANIVNENNNYGDCETDFLQ